MDNQLTSVDLAEGLVTIGNQAFSNNSLTSINIPSTVTSIGEKAFGINKLEHITIPQAVNTIGEMAFSDNNLTSAVIYNKDIQLGGDIFKRPSVGFTIYSWDASKAHEYATANNQKFAPLYNLNYHADANGTITGAEKQIVSPGTTVSELTATEVTAIPKEGYHFVSWSDGVETATRLDNNVSSDLDVTATFAINEYTVVFDSNGGSAIAPLTAEYDATITLPVAPTKTGFTFTGWNTKPDGSGTTYVAGSTFRVTEKNITLYAQWKATATGGSSGGGGGGGSSIPSTNSKVISASTGGTAEIAGAKVEVPTNALTSSFKVTVKKVENTSDLSMTENNQLASDVYEITKDRLGEFERNVTITLPFDISKYDNENYEYSLFWFNEETKKWVELDNVTVDYQSGKVSGEVNHFTKFAVLATEKETKIEEPTKEDESKANTETEVIFTDIKGHWAENQITELVVKGATKGYPDGTFKPNNTISRAEFASMTVKALGLTCQQGEVFADTANHWAKDCISTAVANGIVTGIEADTFAPNDPITREQMAVIISRAANLEIREGTTSFKDDAQLSAWAKPSVAAAAKQNLVGGLPDGTFNPQGKATRAEAAVMITRLINKQ